MTLRTKLWLLVVASSLTGIFLLISMTLIIGALFNKGYTHVELNQIGENLAQEAEQTDGGTNQVKAIFSRYVKQHPAMQLEWFSEDGTLRYATDGQTDPYSFQQMMSRFLNMPSSLWETGEDITLVFDWEQKNNRQYLLMTLPSEAMNGSQFFFYVRDNLTLFQLLIPLALFLLTPYLFAMVFFSRINRRLKRLNRAVSRMDAQGEVISIEDRSKDEIGQLTRHFNAMSERIRDQVTQIQEFDNKRKALIANISHDLRTPMTMIIGYSETLDAGLYKNEEERKTYTEIILRRSRYMDQLLQKLLEIAQLDTQKDRMRREQIDLSEQLRRITADYIPVLENREMAFNIHIPKEPAYVLIDAHLIERAIRNLIENAIQYGREGKYLGLALIEKDNQIEVSINDRGPGIEKAKQTRIFERFYRGSDGREGEGLGIGLSIVHEIADAHGGMIRMKSLPHEETTFTLILPKQ
ncbi:MAG TPA: HAMP domain-containing sensor histidine kinase [Bacillales bacterium]|nr:HAMP domain-containing sensor histidine kinase [Bacillales bacterium]